MWLLTLLQYITGFIPRPIIMRKDEGGFRQTPKLWRCWPLVRKSSPDTTWLKELKPCQWYWYIPWIMEHEVCRIKPQVKDIRIQSVWTKDGIDIAVGSSIRYYVKDWMKALLEVLDYDESLQTVALAVIEEFVEERTLSELKENRNVLREELLKAVKDASRGWGLQIQSVGTTDIGKTINIRLLNSGD